MMMFSGRLARGFRRLTHDQAAAGQPFADIVVRVAIEFERDPARRNAPKLCPARGSRPTIERQDHHLDKALDNELIGPAHPRSTSARPVRIERPDPECSPVERLVRGYDPDASAIVGATSLMPAEFRRVPRARVTLELYCERTTMSAKGCRRPLDRRAAEASREPTENIIIGNTGPTARSPAKRNFEGVAASGRGAQFRGRGGHRGHRRPMAANT